MPYLLLLLFHFNGALVPPGGIRTGERKGICTQIFTDFLLASAVGLSEYRINKSTAEWEVDMNLRTPTDVHTLAPGSPSSALVVHLFSG